MPGPGPHLMYAMASALALTTITNGRFSPHHTLTYTVNAFFGPDIGSFSEWLASLSDGPAQSLGSALANLIHHPFYYILILGLPLSFLYSRISTYLLRTHLLDSVSRENGKTTTYTWILSTGWWQSRAPVTPDAVLVVGFLYSGRQVWAEERLFVLDGGSKTQFSKLTPLPLHATFFSKSLNHFLLLLSKNPSFSLRNLTLSLLRSPFRHRRSTSGVKSFQINRSVCEAELCSLNCRALTVEEPVVVKLYSASVNVRSRSESLSTWHGLFGVQFELSRVSSFNWFTLTNLGWQLLRVSSYYITRVHEHRSYTDFIQSGQLV
ncbi:hypothetical protein LR48_Vigan01g238100 [Vigna angularis]|uniref:Uncharacterized protein n=1 Tax=Phaseolus angularis TaxID=3914 RepID=A0A0L9TQI9_PHAAN|nr:hypothetical protein LR48_Vigan01g238100 [Vigna angularis]